MHVRDDVDVYTFLTLSGSSKVDDVPLNYIFTPLLFRHFETTVLLVLWGVSALPAAPGNTNVSLFVCIFPTLFLIDRLAIYILFTFTAPGIVLPPLYGQCGYIYMFSKLASVDSKIRPPDISHLGFCPENFAKQQRRSSSCHMMKYSRQGEETSMILLSSSGFSVLVVHLNNNQQHFNSIPLSHKSLREQALNLQIGLCYCGESHWGLLARPLNSTSCNPPIWLHSRWVEVCDLLKQFCAWLPWPVLVWHLLLLVGLYPDLHTGLVYSCLAEKCKHTHNTHNTLAIPWGEAKSFAGREALALCVIALASYSRQLAGRWTGNMLCWTKLQPWLQKPLLIWP